MEKFYNECFTQQQELCTLFPNSFYPPYIHQHAHPIICRAHATRQKDSRPKKSVQSESHEQEKRSNSSFANAYEWFTKDRWPHKANKNRSRPQLQELEDDEAQAFLRWLCSKYSQYQQENDRNNEETLPHNQSTDVIPVKSKHKVDYIMEPKELKPSHVPGKHYQSSTNSLNSVKSNATFVKYKGCCNTKCAGYRRRGGDNIGYIGRPRYPIAKGKNQKPNEKITSNRRPMVKKQVSYKPKRIDAETQYEHEVMLKPVVCREQPPCYPSNKSKRNRKRRESSEVPSIIFMEVKDAPSDIDGIWLSPLSLDAVAPNEDTDQNLDFSDEMFEDLQRPCICLEKVRPSKSKEKCMCGCTVQTSDVAIDLDEALDRALFVKIIQRMKAPEKWY